jgi:hypothetical protein
MSPGNRLARVVGQKGERSPPDSATHDGVKFEPAMAKQTHSGRLNNRSETIRRFIREFVRFSPQLLYTTYRRQSSVDRYGILTTHFIEPDFIVSNRVPTRHCAPFISYPVAAGGGETSRGGSNCV